MPTEPHPVRSTTWELHVCGASVRSMTHTRRTPRRALLALVAASMLALSGCGSDTETDATADGDAPAPVGTEVTAVGTEFAFELSQDSFSPGDYTFTLDNQGSMSHDLVIEGPGVDQAATSITGPGDTDSVSVTLEPGTYEIWCSVGSHRAQGMEVTIEVA